MSRIDDGHGAVISFADDPTVKFYEKEITPPGLSGGGPNDTTTLLNAAWRTLAPKKLKTMAPASLSVSYDAAVFTDVPGMINANQLITITFPDGGTLAFWGWLDEFTPGPLVEGAQPTADITIQTSNQNASGTETAPAYTPPV